MATFCVYRGKHFKQKARLLNLAESALDNIIFEYINSVGDPIAFPTDDYILNKYNPKYSIKDRLYYSDLKLIWDNNYSVPKVLTNLREANKYAREALQVFPEEAVVIKPLNNGFYEVIVGKPVMSESAPKADTVMTEEMLSIKDKAIANGTFMLAPNGNHTNLSELQWLLVRTKAFKEWFGDWENDSANASKVVDENGEPLVVYHGDNNADINNWEDKFRGSIHGYFTPALKAAEVYKSKGKIYEGFLNIRNPYTWTKDGQSYRDENDIFGDWSNIDRETAENLNKLGYDGIYVPQYYNSYLAIKNPNQIKSATGNVGTFSRNNNNIYYSTANDDVVALPYTDKKNLDRALRYASRLIETANPLLEEKLKTFLDRLGFNIQEGVSTQEMFGTNAFGAIDIVNRVIYLSNTRNVATLPEEFSHAFVEFLSGAYTFENPMMKQLSKDYKFLMDEVLKTSIYKRVLDIYSDLYTDENGNLDVEKLKKEAIGQALSEALIRRWELVHQEKVDTKDNKKGFWATLKRVFNRIVNFFRGSKLFNFDSVVDSLARDILNDKVDMLKDVAIKPLDRLFIANDLKNIMYLTGPIKYTEELEKVIQEAVNAIVNIKWGKEKSSDIYSRMIAIQGKAGVGKTTVAREIINRVASIAETKRVWSFNVIGGALSWQATTNLLLSMIRDSNNRKFGFTPKTIAGMLNAKQEEGKFVYQSIEGLSRASLVIVDEASMVNEEAFKFFESFVKNYPKVPILFLGDPGQLPPIREERTNTDALSPVFSNDKIRKFSLFTRMRQGEDSPILDYADGFWNFAMEKSNDFPKDSNRKSVVNDNGAIIFQRSDDELLQRLLGLLFAEAVKTRNPFLVRYIAYRTDDSKNDSTITRYNKMFRQLAMKIVHGNDFVVPSDSYIEGDLIIFNDSFNTELGQIYNSTCTVVEKVLDTFTVRGVEGVDGIGADKEVKMQRLLIKVGDLEYVVDTPIPTTENKNNYNYNLEKLIYAARKKKIPWRVFYNYKEKYANIGFGFAVSSHKSQGSTYEVAVVDTTDIKGVKAISRKTKARGIYTAITRAANVSMIITEFTNTDKLYMEIEKINEHIKNKKLGIPSNYNVEESAEDSGYSHVEEKEIKEVKDRRTLPPEDDDESQDSNGSIFGAAIDMDALNASFENGGSSISKLRKKLEKNRKEKESEAVRPIPRKTGSTSGTASLTKNYDFLNDNKKKKYQVNVPENVSNNQYTKLRKLVLTLKERAKFISFEAESHTYQVADSTNGESVFYTPVTTFLNNVVFRKNIPTTNNSRFSRAMGTTADNAFRIFFGSGEKEFNRAYKMTEQFYNWTDENRDQFLDSARELKRDLESKLGKDLIYITDEDLLRTAGTVIYDGEEYKIAGTMDMIVIDSKGNAYIVDFKTSKEETSGFSKSSALTYDMQTYLYAALTPELDKQNKRYLLKLVHNYDLSNQGKLVIEDDNSISFGVGRDAVLLSDTDVYSITDLEVVPNDKLDGIDKEDFEVTPFKTALAKLKDALDDLNDKLTKGKKGNKDLKKSSDKEEDKNIKTTVINTKGDNSILHPTKKIQFKHKKKDGSIVTYSSLDKYFRFVKSYLLNNGDSKKWEKIKNNVMLNAINELADLDSDFLYALLNTNTDKLTLTYALNLDYGRLLMTARSYQASKDDIKEMERRFHPIGDKKLYRESLEERTRESFRQSDATLEFYSNTPTKGNQTTTQRLTDDLDEFEEKYLGHIIGGPLNKIVEAVTKHLLQRAKSIDSEELTINIAGSRITKLVLSKTLADYNKRLTDIIEEVQKRLEKKGVQITKIISGGLSGIDLAGIMAALALGIDWEVYAPATWSYISGKEGNKDKWESGKLKFIERFLPSHPMNLGEKINISDKKEEEEEEELLPETFIAGPVENSRIGITARSYKKDDPLNHKNVLMVFTENAQAATVISAVPETELYDNDDSGLFEGISDKEQVYVNVKEGNTKDNKGNQAAIRLSKEGKSNLNTFGIIVKKRQEGRNSKGERVWLKMEGCFHDTPEDREMFETLNTAVFNKILKVLETKAKNSDTPITLLFPSQLALGKAALPESFAKWLQSLLKERFGIDSKVDKNETDGYTGYGVKLLEPSKQKVQLMQTDEALESLPSYGEEQLLQNLQQLTFNIKTFSTTINTDVKQSDTYTFEYHIGLEKNKSENGEGLIPALVLSMAFSSAIYLDSEEMDETFFRYLAGLYALKSVYPSNEVKEILITDDAVHNKLVEIIKNDKKYLPYNIKERKLVLPVRFTVGYDESEIALRNLRKALLSNPNFTLKELRATAKNAVYFLSKMITEIQSTRDGYRYYFYNPETWETDPNKDVNFQDMDRIEIIHKIGLGNLFENVKDRFFNSDLASDDVDLDTLDDMDTIYYNWDAFIQLAYDSLMQNEEIALDGQEKLLTYINSGTEDANEGKEELQIAEEKGNVAETWQVGFRQVSTFVSLSGIIRHVFDGIQEIDAYGNFVLNRFGLPTFIQVLERVSLLLLWLKDAMTLEDMINILEEKALGEDNKWVELLLNKFEYTRELVDGKSVIKFNEKAVLFRELFFSNFRKYFQGYSIIFRDNKGVAKLKYINEGEYADSYLYQVREKEAAFALGMYKLKTKEGKLNQETFKKLKKASDFLVGLNKEINKKGKIWEVLGDKYEEYLNTVKEVLDLLDLPLPDESTFTLIFNVKSNYTEFINALRFIADEKKLNSLVEDNIEFTNSYNKKSVASEYKRIIKLITKEMDSKMESVTYLDGKLYYSHVMPAFLNRLVGRLKGNNMTDELRDQFFMDEYLQYSWFCNKFSKTGKPIGIRNYWLRTLYNSNPARAAFAHTVSLLQFKKSYVNKTPLEYATSMLRYYFYDDTYAWFRVPTLSNKPSEEYIKFVKFTESDFKDLISKWLTLTFLLELDRIFAVKERRKDPNFSKIKIDNFDEKGLEFLFLDYIQLYRNQDYKQNVLYNEEIDDIDDRRALMDSFSSLLKQLLSEDENGNDVRRNDDATPAEEILQSAEFLSTLKDIIDLHMTLKFEEFLKTLEKEGVISYQEKKKGKDTVTEMHIVKGIVSEKKGTVRDLLELFFWNDVLASINILQLTITDLAFYKNSEDLLKRLALIHAPGLQGSLTALSPDGTRYTEDGIHRTIYLSDEVIVSEILSNLNIIFANLKKEAKTEEEKKALDEQLAYIRGKMSGVNVTDALGYSSPTSYRKKLGIFGQWSGRQELAYQALVNPNKNPDVKITDLLDVLFLPLKPFVFTQTSKKGYNSYLPQLKVGMQNKNSEYLLLIYDALAKIGNVPNKLLEIYLFMEDSQGDVLDDGTFVPNGRGIDTIQFISTVKTGGMGVIDISGEREAGEVYRILLEAVYSTTDNGDGTFSTSYNQDVVHELSFEDYVLQQNVPSHFRNHFLAMGSLDRILSVTDVKDDALIEIDGKEVLAKELRAEYFSLLAENVTDSLADIVRRFKLDNADVRQRNVVLSKMLKNEILKDSRFGTDLLWACDTNEFGYFNIPLSDPIHSNRIQLLLNSIIKNTMYDQEVAGGPVVLVTSFGLSEELHIRFKNSKGKILLSEKEFNSGKRPSDYNEEIFESPEGYETYKDYIKDQKGLAYYEVYCSIYDKDLLKDFIDSEGNVDVERMRKTNPKLLDLIAYRIPTENKYSMLPCKIKGFLTNISGEVIIMPKEITELTGSDFDVDKMYIMRYVFDRKEKDGKVTYEDPLDDRQRRNNRILDIQRAFLTSKESARNFFTPGNFDKPKKQGYLTSVVQQEAIRTGRPTKELYDEYKNYSISQLKEKAYKQLNLVYNHVQILFHKQNMIASKLIGIFALANVSHGFMSLVEGTLMNVKGIEFAIDDLQVGTPGGSMEDPSFVEIDAIYEKNGHTYISSNLASLLAASVDAVKDPILNLLNINMDTVNVVVALLRLGFTLELVSLLVSLPVIQDVVNRHNINPYNDLQSISEEIFDELIKEDLTLVNLAIETTSEDLISNLDGKDLKTNYIALSIFRRAMEVADLFRDITHMTRYNSKTAAVGPFVSDTMLLRIKRWAFEKAVNNEVFNDKVLEAVNNPLLRALRDGSDRAERLILGRNMILARNEVLNALTTLSGILNMPRGVSNSLALKFIDFYMSYILNMTPSGLLFLTDSSVPTISKERREFFIKKFPLVFMSLKSEFSDNALVKTILYKTNNSEEFPFLELNSRRFSDEAREDLKKSWIELFQRGGKARDLALALVEYNYFRGSLGFNPKTFMSLVPGIIKTALSNYISSMNTLMESEDFECFGCNEFRIITLFMLHNTDECVKFKLDKFDEVEYIGNDVVIPKASKNYNFEQMNLGALLEVEDALYQYIASTQDNRMRLRKVHELGGLGQGFEISLDEDIPETIFSKRDKTEDSNGVRYINPTVHNMSIILKSFFTAEEFMNYDLEENEANYTVLAKDINRQFSNLNKSKQKKLRKYGNIRINVNDLSSFMLHIREILGEKGKSIENIEKLFDDVEVSLDDLNLCD